MLLMSSSTESFLELLGVLLIFLFVLVITWLATRYMANFQKSKNAGNNMQVIETISIGNGKYLSLVALGEIYLVVSVGKDEVPLISKITKEELPNCVTEAAFGHTESFQQLLQRTKEKLGNNSDKKE